MYIKLLMKEIRHCVFKIFKMLFYYNTILLIYVVNGMGACIHTLRIKYYLILYYLGYWDS